MVVDCFAAAVVGFVDVFGGVGVGVVVGVAADCCHLLLTNLG